MNYWLMINYPDDSDHDSVDDMIARILPSSWERIETTKADSLFEPEADVEKMADTGTTKGSDERTSVVAFNQWSFGSRG